MASLTRICYSVIATIPTAEMADEYVAWLQDGHVDAVVNAGAHSAMIVRLHPSGAPSSHGPAPARVMTQYIFQSRPAFDLYIDKHAPGLRADGLKRFPPDRGVTFERLTGDIV